MLSAAAATAESLDDRAVEETGGRVHHDGASGAHSGHSRAAAALRENRDSADEAFPPSTTYTKFLSSFVCRAPVGTSIPAQVRGSSSPYRLPRRRVGAKLEPPPPWEQLRSGGRQETGSRRGDGRAVHGEHDGRAYRQAGRIRRGHVEVYFLLLACKDEGGRVLADRARPGMAFTATSRPA